MRFVVLEGLDGAGTTTQAGLLADELHARDLRVCLTAEPSDGPVGRVLRSWLAGEVELGPQAAALAFTADRADHLARVIRPALGESQVVVCDRYLLSTLAYQGAAGVDREWILECSADFDRPDLTIFLDVSGPAQSARLAGRGGRERFESPGDQAALRSAYAESIALLRRRGGHVEVLDADAPVADVRGRVLALVDAVR